MSCCIFSLFISNLSFSLAICFTTPSPRVFWQMTNIIILCCNVKQQYKPAGSDTQRDTERERERETESERDKESAREGVFILRQQLKWVIIALKFHSDWAPLTCHCESSHKENGIFRESCTLTLVN